MPGVPVTFSESTSPILVREMHEGWTRPLKVGRKLPKTTGCARVLVFSQMRATLGGTRQRGRKCRTKRLRLLNGHNRHFIAYNVFRSVIVGPNKFAEVGVELMRGVRSGRDRLLISIILHK